jgi:hypothetical protein
MVDRTTRTTIVLSGFRRRGIGGGCGTRNRWTDTRGGFGVGGCVTGGGGGGRSAGGTTGRGTTGG